MFAESKLTFAAWTGFGITAASIGTVVYKRSGGFGSLYQKNSGNKNQLINKLTQEDSEKQKTKEEDLEDKKPNPQEIEDRVETDLKSPKTKEDLDATKSREETEDTEKEQEDVSEEGIPSFTLGGEDEDELELEIQK